MPDELKTRPLSSAACGWLSLRNACPCSQVGGLRCHVRWYRATHGSWDSRSVSLLLCQGFQGTSQGNPASASLPRAALLQVPLPEAALQPKFPTPGGFSTVELVFSFFNSWRMPDRTWVCRQEPKVQFIGFLRPEHRAKSPALGFVA